MPTRSPSTEYFFTAFADSPVGMALVGLNGHCLEVNPALCRILGYRREELLGRSFQDLTHPDDLAADVRLMERLLAGEIDSYKLERRYRHADGRLVWGLLTVSLSRNDAHCAECFISQLVDISEQKKAIEDRDAFFALSPDLLAITNADGYLQQVNPAWSDALGWTPEDLTSRPFLEFVHPDDLARTAAEAEKVYRGGLLTGFRNRYRHADGGYRWLEWSTRALPNGLLYCSVRELTAQIENEERLRAQEQKIRLLIDNANDAFLGMNAQGIITEWNKQAEITFGWAAHEAIGQPMSELMTPRHLRQRHLQGLTAFQRQGREQARPKRVELPALRKDGSEILVEITVEVVPFGGEQYFHAFLRDVSEQRRMTEELHYRATHDFLTGLANRYEFMGRLGRAIDTAARSPRPLLLLFIDLDGFKAVNDLCGHDTGDAVLIEFGRRLELAVRRTDLVARLAGDEFVVVLDHVPDPLPDAEQVSRKILDAACQPYAGIAGRLDLGASIGLAHYLQDDTPDTLLPRADAAMYVAKKAGKNRLAFLRDGEWVVGS